METQGRADRAEDGTGGQRADVGRELREARETLGISIEEVGKAINVHAHHLAALERGDLEALPGPLTRWILIRYADHLHLPGRRFANRLVAPQRSSADAGFLGRHRRAALAALGVAAMAAVVVLTVVTILVPYNPVTDPVDGILHDVAPGVFWGDEPQRVVVLGPTERAASGEDNLLVAKVAEEGISLLFLPYGTPTDIPGHGRGSIADAVTVGGPDLARRSVARLTGAEVANYCMIDARGIREIVGAVGGVRIYVPQPTSGRAAPGGPLLTLRPGRQTLDGDEALVYLQGNDLPSGAGRAVRQQDFLNAMLRQALGPSNLIANPSTLRVLSENTETNMGSLQLVQLVSRVRALEESGTPIQARGAWRGF